MNADCIMINKVMSCEYMVTDDSNSLETVIEHLMKVIISQRDQVVKPRIESL